MQHALPELALIFTLRLEGVEKRLVLTGGVGAALDTELVEGLDKAETSCGDTDRADQAGLISIDLVCRCRYIIGTGGADIGNHSVNRSVRMQRTQALDLVIHVAGLHRTAAGAVDA